MEQALHGNEMRIIAWRFKHGFGSYRASTSWQAKQSFGGVATLRVPDLQFQILITRQKTRTERLRGLYSPAKRSLRLVG